MRATLLAAAAALALAGCQSMAGESAMPMAAGDMTPTQASPYVMMAVASDLYEIQSSRLALQRSQRADVRQFAQMMIDHHSRTTQQLWAAAQASGIVRTHEWMLPPPKQQMIAALQQRSGAGFDSLYLQQQVQAHGMALALHRSYAQSGDRAPLRQFAATAVPVVAQHLQRARTMTN